MCNVLAYAAMIKSGDCDGDCDGYRVGHGDIHGECDGDYPGNVRADGGADGGGDVGVGGNASASLNCRMSHDRELLIHIGRGSKICRKLKCAECEVLSNCIYKLATRDNN